jgi:hypothetical protein
VGDGRCVSPARPLCARSGPGQGRLPPPRRRHAAGPGAHRAGRPQPDARCRRRLQARGRRSALPARRWALSFVPWRSPPLRGSNSPRRLRHLLFPAACGRDPLVLSTARAGGKQSSDGIVRPLVSVMNGSSRDPNGKAQCPATHTSPLWQAPSMVVRVVLIVLLKGQTDRAAFPSRR